MLGGLRWLGLGVSLGATLSTAVGAGAGRRAAIPRGVASLSLDPVPAVDQDAVDNSAAASELDDTAGDVLGVDWGRRLDLHEVTLEHVSVDHVTLNKGDRRSDQDRRTGADRRVEDLDGLVGRISRATDKRQGAERRCGSERRMPGREALQHERQRSLNTAA